MQGRTLNHYEVAEQIGAGGMGEVYRARDTRLGRDVALKFLPAAFTDDPERLARFEREARLLASLNHPNIGAIYGLEEAEGLRFLVLELIQGEDLSERLARGPMTADEALPIALQVATALEAAHEQGLVHRDLKPANIKVTPEGVTKVLDFGLAKALEGDGTPNSNLSNSPTVLASSPTMQGVILGTAAYMSPEQARGGVVDKRADVFAFGVVLYEMLGGSGLFGGDTVSDTLAAVLRAEPNWDKLPADIHGAIRKLMRRCLEKDPSRRLRDIGEARIVIEDVRLGVAEEPSALAPAATTGGARPSIAWALLIPVVAVVVAAAVWFLKPGPEPHPHRKISLSVNATLEDPPELPSISPDGTRLVYWQAGSIWLREMHDLEPRKLAETSRTIIPFWSPDGKQVGFSSSNTLYRVPADGGNPTLICETNMTLGNASSSATWGESGQIVFGDGNHGLHSVAASGGDPKEILPFDPDTETDFHQPFFLPGDVVIFVRHRIEHGPDTIALFANGERKDVLTLPDQNIWNLGWSPSGHITYRRQPDNSGLWALPFSLETLEPTGDAFLVTPQGNFASISRDGTLLYIDGALSSLRELVWVDDEGNVELIPGEQFGSISGVSLSPDGTHAAVAATGDGSRDIWIHDLARGTRTRFTFETEYETTPAWSPDGKQIYYRYDAGSSVMVKSVDGSGNAMRLVEGHHPEVSPDGRYVVYTATDDSTRADIWMLPLEEGGEPQLLVRTPGQEMYPRLSPDGRYLAYRSDESGRNEIYLRRFPSGDGKWQVSTEGASWPRWSRDGKRLYFRDDVNINVVDVDTRTGLRMSTPRLLLDTQDKDIQYWGWTSYDTAPDGRLLMVRQYRDPNDTKTPNLVLVEKWFAPFAEQQR